MKQAPMNRAAVGLRRGRNKDPTITRNGDSTTVRYQALGKTFVSDANGNGGDIRQYIPGSASSIFSALTPAGITVTSFYSEGKFKPGTTIRWEPGVSFTTSGRVYVSFSDNPEIIASITANYATYVATPTPANYATYANAVKAMGTMRSFPVWMETDVPFPTKTRRKMFDINSVFSSTDANVLDRSCQTCFFIAWDGCPASTTLGAFVYRDVVEVEGLTATVT